MDNSTTEIWDQVRDGRILGKILPPLLGGLGVMGKIILVDMNIVWWGFMLGMTSHLVADSLTREGVMWLFPIPWRIGFPPFKSLRIKTGGLIEKAIVFPGLVLLNGYLIVTHYQRLWLLVQSWVNKPY